MPNCDLSKAVLAAGVPAVSALLLCTACIGDVDVPPPPPTLFPVSSPTTLPRQEISGTKPRGTAVLDHGAVVVEAGDEQSWSFVLLLAPGENRLELTTRTRRGLVSRDHVEAVIAFEAPCPDGPQLDPVLSPTSADTQTLTGTKPAGVAVELSTLDEDGAMVTTDTIVAAGPETSWSHELSLQQDGSHRFALATRDARGRASEPVLFAIERDTRAPEISAHFPPVGATDVPTAAVVEVVIDGALDTAAAPPDTLVALEEVASGAPLTGSVAYNGVTHSIALQPAGLAMSSHYRVIVSGLVDAAGNRMAGEVTWSFETGNTTHPPAPAAPQITGGTASTTRPAADLVGTKPAWSSIWIDGLQAAPLDPQTTWTVSWPLAVGANELEIAARDVTGASSPTVSAGITRELSRPLPPVVAPMPPGSVSEASLVLAGTKEPGTAVLINGEMAVCGTAETDWGFAASLVPGTNDLELRTRNSDGVASDPVRVSIDFTQVYSGRVPSNYQLYVALSLRDLAGALPVAASFDTGANHYAIDAWLEGPLEPELSCGFDAAGQERRDVALAATIQHYRGTKQGHVNPFVDPDYRSPDFVAALAESGALVASGISPATDRRDEAGHTNATLAAALDAAALAAIDETCGGRSTVAVDGCTEATVYAGVHEIHWLPLAPDSSRLQQGEYLLHLAINLDRDPGWVTANDLEGCWDEPQHAVRGPHRVVHRLSLGDAAYSLLLGPLTELAGADLDLEAPDGQLRYVGDAGVRIHWGPPH